METLIPGTSGEYALRLPTVRTLQKFDLRHLDETQVLDEIGDLTVEEWRKILCRICLNLLTTEDHGIAVNGSHEHTCLNPRGLRFTIGCYDGARGCVVAGVPTDEFTWFPGYRWSFVICANCQSHLGWFYQSRENSFFGFILDQLLKE